MSEIILKREEARKRVAELDGWTHIKLFAQLDPDSDEAVYLGGIPKGVKLDGNYQIESRNQRIPDYCNDLGAATRLLWELPEGWKDYRIWGYGVLDVQYKDSGKPNADYVFETPESFAVACVSAFLTAHLDQRVTITD